jgi:hypothetical protein
MQYISADNSTMGSKGSIEKIIEEEEEEEPPVLPMSNKVKEVLKRELNSLYKEFIEPTAPNEINLTSDCRRRLD